MEVNGVKLEESSFTRNPCFSGCLCGSSFFPPLPAAYFYAQKAGQNYENTLRVSLYAQDAGRVIDFDHRPFKNVEVMDEAMISLWNQRVNHDDNVYILGDFCYRNEKSAEWYLSQLKGHKHLVLGNHDTRLLDNEIAMGYCDSIDRMLYVSDSGKEICLCHYPMSEWNGSYRGHLHFYGHIHDKRDETWEYMNQGENAYNVGCMLYGYRPVRLNEIVKVNRTIGLSAETLVFA